jgi:transcriptional accessory protein Tex/SPT6
MLSSAPYVQPEKGVESAAEAQAGALDIVAQWIADDPKIRALVRGSVKERVFDHPMSTTS